MSLKDGSGLKVGCEWYQPTTDIPTSSICSLARVCDTVKSFIQWNLISTAERNTKIYFYRLDLISTQDDIVKLNKKLIKLWIT